MSCQASLSGQTSARNLNFNLQSSDLSQELQKLVKENYVQKVVFHAQTEYMLANNVAQMLHGIDNYITNDSTSYTRYEIFYCSEVRIKIFYDKNTVLLSH